MRRYEPCAAAPSVFSGKPRIRTTYKAARLPALLRLVSRKAQDARYY